jgi:hypothetical protein
VTGADVIDAIYLEGVAANLRPGDALLFVFGTRVGDQYLRFADAVDVQAAEERTEITLAFEARNIQIALGLYRDKARYLFPGSDIAAQVARILDVVITNVASVPAATVLRGALAQIAAQQTIARARGFTRVAAFLHQLAHVLESLIASGASFTQSTDQNPDFPAPVECWGRDLATSSLDRLDAIVGSLGRPAAVQPRSALQLGRGVERSFSQSSDVAPRLLATLNPAIAGALYQAWAGIASPRNRVQVFAARARASLFAATFAGAATVHPNGEPTFAPPTIAGTWKSLGTPVLPLAALALGALYENITVGSWVAVDRPKPGATPPRAITFHIVREARTVVMDTGAGLSAKVTVLSVEPPWLTSADDTALASHELLNGTLVYAQCEPLTLAPEPLDADIGGGRIDLAEVYDGLEPGRWIIVSGMRTDIPGVTGVAASELAMIAAVSQGSEAPLCAAFPFAQPPFTKVHYVTAADANGDRLVVGDIDPALLETIRRVSGTPAVPLPSIVDQRYCDQVELAPGTYAAAYIPTSEEREGHFPSFDGLLLDPVTCRPFAGGIMEAPVRATPAGFSTNSLFAWRIADQKVHTTLVLASALAYRYDRDTVTIYGNVVDATHGQRVGEVLGDGVAARAYQSFTLAQSPLTYVSAATPSGTSSTLSVRVNDLEWHEVDQLGVMGPSLRRYVTREDESQKTTVTFGNGVYGARLPSGTDNVKAVYRYGLGKDGNVAAGAISQLATHPLGAKDVINPLPATGGGDPDRIEQIRENAPLAVTAFDRLVSVRDYADFARTFAGIGKAIAAQVSDGRAQLVHVTVAGADDIPIELTSDLYQNLVASLEAFGDPHQRLAVDVRRVKLIVMSASVGLLPDYAWEFVVPKIRAALLATFAFEVRALGQAAFLSEAVRAAQDVEGVAFVNVTIFDGIGEDTSAKQLAALGSTLTLRPYVRAEQARVDRTADPGAPGRIVPAELVFLTPDIPDTLILNEAGA